MGTLGENSKPTIGIPASAPAINFCSGFEPEKIDRPKPAWIPADWGDHYDTLYNYCNFGHEGKSERAYGDVIGYRIDPGNSTYQYYDPSGKFLYAVPRAKGGIPAPLIAAAIAVIAPELAAAINESLTTAGTFESAATTEAVSQGIAKTTLQVASGTQSAEATNTVDSVLNNPDVSAAIVTTAGIIVQNQAAGKSTAAVTKAATNSITSPAAVTAVNTAAATLPAKVTTMTDTTSAQDQAVMEFAKAEIAAGRTVQQITDDIKTYFNKTFTTQQVSDYLAANNLTIQAAQTATGLSSNTLLMVGGGLLLLLLLGKK